MVDTMQINLEKITRMAERAGRAASLMRGPDERVNTYFEGQYIAIEMAALADLGISPDTWRNALKLASK